MKKIRYFILILGFAGLVTACNEDSDSEHNVNVYGSFYDVDTDELVQQDPIDGTAIELRQYENSSAPRFLLVKNDGTYSNPQLPMGLYNVRSVYGNFITLDSQYVRIDGAQLDFYVKPYIRILDVKILRIGDKVRATFKVQQNVVNNVSKLGLYGSYSRTNVGETVHLVATENNVNVVLDPDQFYTLEIDVPSNRSQLISGRDYFFRVGALIDVKGAKLNYSHSIRISL